MCPYPVNVTRNEFMRLSAISHFEGDFGGILSRWETGRHYQSKKKQMWGIMNNKWEMLCIFAPKMG